MQIGKKIFPYPVLNNAENYNCYKDSIYALEYDEVEDNNNFILKNVRVFTNNEHLINMLNEKIAKAVVIIECKSTIFKHIEEIELKAKDITIPIKNLSGQVEVSSIVYAKQELLNYYSESFIEDYENYKFNIDKYSILAIDDGFTFKIEYDDFEDKKVSSIFSIIKSYNEELKTMKVYPDDRKIKIELPEEQFTKYDSLKGQEIFSNIFFSIIIIPALSMCLKDIQNEVKYQNKIIADVREQYSWFASIQNAYKKIAGSQLDEESFLQLDVLEFSQQIMNTCSVLSITDFYNIISRTSKEDDD